MKSVPAASMPALTPKARSPRCVMLSLPRTPAQDYLVRMNAAKAASIPAANAFAGFAKAPTAKQVNEALGSSQPLWVQLLSELAHDLQLKTAEWNTSAPKRGWSFRIKQGDRIIAYLTIEQEAFHACFSLGDRALKAALASDLPPAAIQIIRSAKKCAAGTGIRLPIHFAEDVAAAKKLAAAKLQG